MKLRKLSPKVAYETLSTMDPKDITLFRREMYASKYSFVGWLLEKACGYDRNARSRMSYEESNRHWQEYRQFIKDDPILQKMQEIHERLILPFRTITPEYKKYALEEALKAIKEFKE